MIGKSRQPSKPPTVLDIIRNLNQVQTRFAERLSRLEALELRIQLLETIIGNSRIWAGMTGERRS